MKRAMLGVIATLAVGLGGCTTHTHDQPPPSQPTVIHQDMSPSSSAVREGAREGAREGMRDKGM